MSAGELCLGGLIKHVTSVEGMWVTFVLNGPSALPDHAHLTETAQHAGQADIIRKSLDGQKSMG